MFPGTDSIKERVDDGQESEGSELVAQGIDSALDIKLSARDITHSKQSSASKKQDEEEKV